MLEIKLPVLLLESPPKETTFPGEIFSFTMFIILIPFREQDGKAVETISANFARSSAERETLSYRIRGAHTRTTTTSRSKCGRPPGNHVNGLIIPGDFLRKMRVQRKIRGWKVAYSTRICILNCSFDSVRWS